MSGETEQVSSGWTVDTLKYLMDDRQRHDDRYLTLLDRLLQERWAAQEVASKRFQEVSNEFRGALDDLSAKQATKAELAAVNGNTAEKIEALTKTVGELRSRLDLGPVGLAQLQAQAATNAGITQGSQITMGKIYGAVAAAGGVVGIIVFLAGNVVK